MPITGENPHPRASAMCNSCMAHAASQGQALKVTAQRVGALSTEEYPVPAARPHNSRLDLAELQTTFNLTENKNQLEIPPGLAHGFVTLSETAEFLYKTTHFYSPRSKGCIAWDDPAITIEWPIDFAPSLSDKDQPGLCKRRSYRCASSETLASFLPAVIALMPFTSAFSTTR